MAAKNKTKVPTPKERELFHQGLIEGAMLANPSLDRSGATSFIQDRLKIIALIEIVEGRA